MKQHFNSYREGLDLEFLQEYCVNHGDDSFPFEWKTLKSMVNGEKVYYKDAL